ncbi:MAG TPA: 2-oxoglutarate dehydrogenase complex dihydrolipoyllysine-residue succinyltransferase [Terriglobia bacterium]|nr:2-oxoglutarate dehydrogenase complex dihydrolipoyllysine-residue succinyltransferase [Terriglobia bacterium]
MPAKIVVPELGESVLEATVGHWQKKEGDRVSAGEVLVSLETDKVDLEVGAERSGILARIEHQEGDDVKIGDVLGVIEDAPATGVQSSESGARSQEAPETQTPSSETRAEAGGTPAEPPTPSPESRTDVAATPSARRLAREQGVDLTQVRGADRGRLTRKDVETHVAASAKPVPTESQRDIERAASKPAPTEATPETRHPKPETRAPETGALETRIPKTESRTEERVRMSRRRQTIARRLVEAQHTAAMLTTFNEIDMSAVVELRKRHKESFKQKHGVGLGLTSFFVKAAVAALRAFPLVNAEIDGDELILKHYYDIGVAVGAAEGLVVPVLRAADQMSFAAIERAIKEFVEKAENHTLSLEDLRGGTFTITNGGVFGSLMSTPILNPPQVGILGLHKIQERPVTRDGEIVTCPMMYVALSYDHRVVDGREAVQFLVRVKEVVEEPAMLVLEG